MTMKNDLSSVVIVSIILYIVNIQMVEVTPKHVNYIRNCTNS